MNRKYAILLFLILFVTRASATIQLPAIIGDNMVVQRNAKVPIWGKATAGQKIQIVFLNRTFTCMTGPDGKWSVRLATYPSGGPYQMLIKAGSEEIIIQNILIGDVWLASGQSNMEFGIQNEANGAAAISNATDKFIHFFFVPMTFALQPQDGTAPTDPDSPNGKWVMCSPRLMADPKWAWHGFSAVGYYFAQQVRLTQKCPVGMIASYKGGTPAQAWISEAGLKKEPAFEKYISARQTLIAEFGQANAAYPQQLADYRKALEIWRTEVGNSFDKENKQWEAITAQAKANGQAVPPAPKPVRPAPQSPPQPAGGFSAPANLYNAMIAPVVQYGIKGVIWYQGESNGDRLADAVEYKDLFPRLINDWRIQWKQPDLPFLFVQLANFRVSAKTPSEGNWPWVREAQRQALSLPKTGMAVITDVGNADNIHPTNKVDVGLRLALAARHVVYGENIVFSGPDYRSYVVEGRKIRIRFKQTGRGLVIDTVRHPGGVELEGFGIAGADGRFVWAKATLDGNTVLVSSEQIANPVAVRYNWADNPPGNLYNKEGLPASPFRTDDWAPALVVPNTRPGN
ncbi:sialate O-acetylesterase [Mucilaginibacter sp. PAMB04168]|uniref:sialate O-acetylesterase n=1 Tax=Mucilaginibacter sp. PAMB04168 TaxID=3138567 RepID=UPI0031F6BF33